MFKKALVTSVCLTALLACGDKEDNAAAKKIALPEAATSESQSSMSGNEDSSVGENDATFVEDFKTSSGDDYEVEVEEEMPGEVDLEVDIYEQQTTTSDEEANIAQDAPDYAAQAIAVAEEATAREQTSYTVKPGDILSKIAQSHSTTVDAIVQRNNLRNPNSIAVGQQLIIE